MANLESCDWMDDASSEWLSKVKRTEMRSQGGWGGTHSQGTGDSTDTELWGLQALRKC